MALFDRIVAVAYELASVQQRYYGILNILVYESTDERDTVVQILVRKELVGAFDDREDTNPKNQSHKSHKLTATRYRCPTSVRRKSRATRRSNPGTLDSCSVQRKTLAALYSRAVPYCAMHQRYLVLSVIKETRSTPT